MRFFIFLAIMLIPIILLLVISFKRFLKENPTVEQRLNKKYGKDWKDKLMNVLYDKNVSGTIDADEKALLDVLLDGKEFDSQFDMPYIDDDSNDKKYQTLYKKCDSLLK